MAVFKRFKGRRIKPGHKSWSRAKWWMEFSLRGIYVLQSIPGARTQAQAERAESAIREDIYNGRFNKSHKSGRFSEFVDEVYLPWAKANKSSWRNDESRAQALKAVFGNRQIRDITPMMIRRLKNQLLNEKTRRFQAGTKERTLRKGTTVNRYLQLLSKILETAFEESLIDQNPMRRVPLEPEGEGRERYLTYAEEDQLLPQLKDRLAHLHAPIVVDIDTGLRVNSELLRLQIEHCNFGEAPIFFNINGRDVEIKSNHLLVVKSKNRKPRTIPMTERARTELLSVIQERTSGPVFCNSRTGVSYTTLKKGFRSACVAAGIPCGQNTPGGITLHDLRHTFATRLAERGVDESVRMVLLGQSSIKMVRRYSHATPEAMTEAISRLSQRAGDVLEFKRGNRVIASSSRHP